MATSFGNTEDALTAIDTGAALTDLSHWTRLHLAGKDRLTLLHNQVINDWSWCSSSLHMLKHPSHA